MFSILLKLLLQLHTFPSILTVVFMSGVLFRVFLCCKTLVNKTDGKNKDTPEGPLEGFNTDYVGFSCSGIITFPVLFQDHFDICVYSNIFRMESGTKVDNNPLNILRNGFALRHVDGGQTWISTHDHTIGDGDCLYCKVLRLILSDVTLWLFFSLYVSSVILHHPWSLVDISSHPSPVIPDSDNFSTSVQGFSFCGMEIQGFHMQGVFQ